MKVIKKMTRKQFLETMAAAVAGTVIGSLMSGCSSLGHRPHQGIANNIPAEYNMMAKRQGSSVPSKITVRNIVRKEFLGGRLKSYRRAA